MLVKEYRYEDDVAAQREEAFNMGQKEGILAGQKSKSKEDALALYKKGISLNLITECIKISTDQLQEWINEEKS